MKKAEVDFTGNVLKGVIAVVITLCGIIFYDLRDDIKEIKTTHNEKIKYFQGKIDEIPVIYLTKAEHDKLR
jgi:hypothetical protein